MNKEHSTEQPLIKEEVNDGCESFVPAQVAAEASQAEASINESDSLKRAASDDLPLPAGALPPRKRAKTKDEKEQRRIERIMRNRQAAHASREKKRRHLEELEHKCESLTRANADLESQLQRAQRLQVESQERHLALQTRLQQVEAALQAAKSSGDVAILENIQAQTPEEPPVVSDCTSPGNLQLLSIPSLSNSAGNSPAHVDDSEDFEPLDPFSAFPAAAFPAESVDSSSKAHHPAEMMECLL